MKVCWPGRPNPKSSKPLKPLTRILLPTGCGSFSNCKPAEKPSRKPCDFSDGTEVEFGVDEGRAIADHRGL